MDDETTSPDNQGTPEDDDFWTDLVGAAVLSGIALWGINKVTKLFETPSTLDQSESLDLAWKHYAAGEVQKGRESLSKWFNANLTKPVELNGLAWSMSTQKIDPGSAVVIAEHVVRKLAPQNALYLDTLAEAYLAMGRQEDARNACDEAWKYAPDVETQFMLHLRMGMIYEMQPMIQLAIKQYQKAESLNMSSPPYDMSNVYFGLGRCHAANEDWTRSIQAFERSLELRPGNPIIKTFLANGLIGINPPRLQEAQNHLQTALSTMGEWELPYYLMACAKAKANDCSGAAQWCEKGIRYFTPERIETTKTEPLFERCRRQILEVLVGSGHMSKHEYDEAVSPTVNLPRLSLGTAKDSNLRGQLQSAKPRALPYFISFYTEEGQPLAGELRRHLGDEGFMSANDLQTGSQWKKELAKNLKSAKSFLMLETPQYHNRPSCKIERAFAVAAGMRVIRVGLCPHNKLPEYPSYVDELQYEDFVKEQDNISLLLERILKINLPSPVDDSKTRRDAGIELVRGLTPSQIDELADFLEFGDDLQDKSGPIKNREFLKLAFRTDLVANQFCKELNLASLFK